MLRDTYRGTKIKILTWPAQSSAFIDHSAARSHVAACWALSVVTGKPLIERRNSETINRASKPGNRASQPGNRASQLGNRLSSVVTRKPLIVRRNSETVNRAS
jgi:hypothetical protein